MVSFEVYNATLWNIFMMINKAEHESCSMQLIRAYNNTFNVYGRKSPFLDASIEIMKNHDVPIVLVDYSMNTWDQEYMIRNRKRGVMGAFFFFIRSIR